MYLFPSCISYLVKYLSIYLVHFLKLDWFFIVEFFFSTVLKYNWQSVQHGDVIYCTWLRVPPVEVMNISITSPVCVSCV